MFLCKIGTEKDKTLENFEILKEFINSKHLSNINTERLNQELNGIKEQKTAATFLNLIELHKLDEVKIPTFWSKFQYSYITFVLGISSFDPIKYNLPHFPEFNWDLPILVKNKKDLQIIKKIKIKQLKSCWGLNHFKGSDLVWEMMYNHKELTFENFEKIMRVDNNILKKNFRDKINNLSEPNIENLCNAITEHIISKWRKIMPRKKYKDDDTSQKISNIPHRFQTIFFSTDNKLLYQEQLFEICKSLLGYDYKRFNKLNLAINCEDPFTRPLLTGNDEDFLEEVLSKSADLEWKGLVLPYAITLEEILKNKK